MSDITMSEIIMSDIKMSDATMPVTTKQDYANLATPIDVANNLSEILSPRALGLVRVVAFLRPRMIAEKILEQHTAAALMGDMGVSYPKPGKEYIESRDEILRTCLFRRCAELNELNWLDVSLQAVVRENMNRQDQQIYYSAAIDLLYKTWTFAEDEDKFNRDSLRQKTSDLPFYDVLSMASAYDSAVPESGLLPVDARQFVELLQDTAWHFVQRENYDYALPPLKLAWRICDEYGSEMNDMMADTAFIFARYGEETNMDRKTVYDYSLQCHYLWKDLVNGTTEYLEDLTMSHTSLAQGYLLRDKPDKAVEHCQESIRIRAEFRNDGSICELAHILQAWGMCGLGDYDQAALLCEAVIQYRAERFGPEDRSSIKLGLALQCLGATREKQGRLAEAYDAYQRALANFEKVLRLSALLKQHKSFRIAQVKLKLAELGFALNGNSEMCRTHLHEAISILDPQYYKPELARTWYKMFQFYAATKMAPSVIEGVAGGEELSREKALKLYYELHPDAPRDTELADGDFDELVAFWSR